MIALYIFLAILGGCSLFVAGFYTGVWIQRHSYNDREVPKIITTEKLVTVDRPVVVPAPPPKSPASLPVMGGPRSRSVVGDPVQREEMERVEALIGNLPEA